MSEPTYDDFIANLISILEKNGYPSKRVALSLERMYEVAYTKQLNFNKALKFLDERGIAHEKTVERVIFFPKANFQEVTQPKPKTAEASSPFSSFAGMDFKNLSADKLKDTLSQAEALMKNLPEEQLQKMMAMFQTMSPKERESIMEKAKKFGLG